MPSSLFASIHSTAQDSFGKLLRRTGDLLLISANFNILPMSLADEPAQVKSVHLNSLRTVETVTGHHSGIAGDLLLLHFGDSFLKCLPREIVIAFRDDQQRFGACITGKLAKPEREGVVKMDREILFPSLKGNASDCRDGVIRRNTRLQQTWRT